jgi:hypothetical protein
MLPQHQAHVLVLQVMFSALPFGSHISFELAPSSSVSSLVVPMYVSYLPSLGRFPTYLVPSVRRKLRSAGLCGTSG